MWCENAWTSKTCNLKVISILKYVKKTENNCSINSRTFVFDESLFILPCNKVINRTTQWKTQTKQRYVKHYLHFCRLLSETSMSTYANVLTTSPKQIPHQKSNKRQKTAFINLSKVCFSANINAIQIAISINNMLLQWLSVCKVTYYYRFHPAFPLSTRYWCCQIFQNDPSLHPLTHRGTSHQHIIDVTSPWKENT